MAGLFLAKPIYPTSITSREMNAYFLNALLRVKENVEQDYKATTATWQEHHPRFRVFVRYGLGSARVLGGPVGEDLDSKVWHWIDSGTTHRKAVMSWGFRPKTRYRVIGSTAGKGRMIFVSKYLWLPGIKAREFTQAIQENNADLLDKEIRHAIFKAISLGVGPKRRP